MTQSMVKIFYSTRHDDLGRQLNQWLHETAGQVQIIGVSLDSNDYGHSVVVMYQQGGESKLYRAHLFFHRRHDNLEREVNQGLQAAQAQWGKFVAIGSNQHGHCLCVIEER